MAEASSNKRKIFDNRYEVLARVGRGSASVVYRAKQLKNPDVEVALKVLTGHSKVKPSAELLRKEALAMVSSRHPHVIRLNDFHSLDDICYLSMEYAKEGDLRQYLKKRGDKLSFKKAELFLLQAASALNFIHNKARITHRDIKPENILVFDDNNIRIGDFGVALLAGEQFSLEQLQRGVGTMDYMAPEVLKGEACDMKSDIYALGVTFYELISGKHPFEGASLARAIDIRKDGAVKSLKEIYKKIPAYLSDIIEKCMKFDPEDRYPTAAQLVSAFNAHDIYLPGTEAQPAKPVETQTPTKKQEPTTRMKKPGESLSLKGSAPLKTADQKFNAPEKKSVSEKPVQKSPEKVPPKASDPTLKNVAEQTSDKEATSNVVPFNQPASKVAPMSPPKKKSPEAEEKATSAVPAAGTGGAALADRMRRMVEEHEETKNDTDSTPVKPEIAQTPLTPKAPEPPQKTEAPTQKAEENPLSKSPPTSRPESIFRPQKPEISLGAKKSETTSSAPTLTAKSTERQQRDRQQERMPGTAKRSADSRQLLNIAIGTLIGIFLLFLAPKLFTSSSEKSEQQVAQTENTLENSQEGISSTGNEQSQTESGQQNTQQTQQNAETTQASLPVFRLPPVKAETLQFPLLPGGLYIGSLESLFLKKDIPITILSLESRRELVITLGIAGSKPTRIQLPADGSQKSFQISANGFLYELTAQVRGDKIEGIFQNIITGEQGSWQLFPVRS